MSEQQLGTPEIIAQIIDAGGSLSYNYRKEGRHALLDPRFVPVGYVEDDVVTFVDPDFDIPAFKAVEEKKYNLHVARIYVSKAIEDLKAASDWHTRKCSGESSRPLPAMAAIEAAQSLTNYRKEIIDEMKKLT
jgi:hypothetical protein